MKVFLASSVGSLVPRHEIYDDLIRYIKASHDTFHYERNVTISQDNYRFEELVEAIGAADVFIAEMTRASQTLGFQLAHALRLSKPCLYLYDAHIKEKPDGLIGNIPSRNLKIKGYTHGNYRKIIDNFFSFAEKQQETYRTSFMSTREIDQYIAVRAAETGMSKGEIIRELLHAAIQHNS